jgi:hypothetical protein
MPGRRKHQVGKCLGQARARRVGIGASSGAVARALCTFTTHNTRCGPTRCRVPDWRRVTDYFLEPLVLKAWAYAVPVAVALLFCLGFFFSRLLFCSLLIFSFLSHDRSHNTVERRLVWLPQISAMGQMQSFRKSSTLRQERTFTRPQDSTRRPRLSAERLSRHVFGCRRRTRPSRRSPCRDTAAASPSPRYQWPR